MCGAARRLSQTCASLLCEPTPKPPLEDVMTKLSINGREVEVSADPDTPLLWVVRDELQLTGAKFGCGQALCGACTMYADGSPIRACVTPIESVAGQNITTPEGLEGRVDGYRHRRSHDRQPLSLRHLRPHPHSHQDRIRNTEGLREDTLMFKDN